MKSCRHGATAYAETFTDYPTCGPLDFTRLYDNCQTVYSRFISTQDGSDTAAHQAHDRNVGRVFTHGPRAVGTRRRSKSAALLLRILLGFGDAHRYYEGKFARGVVYLLTGELFAVGRIIDIARIAGKPEHDESGCGFLAYHHGN